MDGHFQRDTLMRKVLIRCFPPCQEKYYFQLSPATSLSSSNFSFEQEGMYILSTGSSCSSSSTFSFTWKRVQVFIEVWNKTSPLSHSSDCEPPATYEQGRLHLGWRSRSPRTSRSACPSPRSECPSSCKTSSASGTCGPGRTSRSPWHRNLLCIYVFSLLTNKIFQNQIIWDNSSVGSNL